ncbi:MAG TPA: Crp/Fnr family transcriptional regulator [Candidatus Limnocylindrales bacterium]|jgi:CRP/FNR family transcriptional regulator|nr:Crp/Fnr family transcriptional regulator [Candidatus Limnocylindrales bacterium]
MALADDTVVRHALRASGLFGAAGEDVIDALVRVLRIRRFRRGETVFHQGDPGDALFIIASGSVKVVLPSEVGPEPAIVAILGPGEFFGELAILDGAPHSATIVAVESTESLVLHRDAFLALIDSEADLRRALLASLASEIRRLTGHVEDLHFLDLPGRLASRILRLAAHEPVTEEGVRIAWPYTQSELAGMIGGSRQSVNRLLADLTDQGLVRLERDHLVVADVERLARTVDR